MIQHLIFCFTQLWIAFAMHDFVEISDRWLESGNIGTLPSPWESHVVVAAVNNFMFFRPWMCWASLKIHALTEEYLIVFQTAKILTSTTLSDWNFGIKWMKSSKPWKQSCLILSIKCNTSQIFLTQSSPPLTICFTKPLSIPPSLCVCLN